jgi:hypothetical protein
MAGHEKGGFKPEHIALFILDFQRICLARVFQLLLFELQFAQYVDAFGIHYFPLPIF